MGGGVGDHSSYDWGWGGIPKCREEAKPLQGLFSTMSMAENGDVGGRVEVGMEGWGRQQTGQEFHWAPRGGVPPEEGTRGLTHGTGVIQESVPQERERIETKTAGAAHEPKGRAGTCTGDSRYPSRPSTPVRTPGQQGQDTP